MSADPVTAEHARGPASWAPGGGGFLGLVRRIVDFGRDMIATLQAHTATSPPLDIARRFGSLNLALIIAAALERRLLHPRPRIAGQVKRAAPTTTPTARAPRQPRPDEEAELHGDLPTAREIAARVRNRRIGAVIAEICRDLGIDGEDPLWRELHPIIVGRGGNMAKLLRILVHRGAERYRLAVPLEPDPRFDRIMAALTTSS